MRPRVAILPWGDAIEDFLDTLSVSLEDFRDEMTGGWLFGYVEALKTVGVDAAVVCVSRDPRAPLSWRHRPTGAELLVLPQPRAYARVRRLVADPYSAQPAPPPGAGRAGRLLAAGAHQAVGYLATPVGALARALRDGGFTALLCQEYEYQRFDVCALAARRLGVPVFASFQGGAAPRTALERLVRPHAMRRAAGFVVGSGAEGARMRARYGVRAERVVHASNPVDVHVWRAGDRRAARAELGLPEDAVVTAWHGRVDIHRKGLDVLLHAWLQLRDRRDLPQRRLLMIGSGADRDELRRRLGHAGGDDVVWLDRYVLDKPRMARLLSAADLYVLPSRHEGFPVAPLEAMAVGLPVVAADAPGVQDIFAGGEADGGVIVARGDGAVLAEALASVIADPHRRRALARRATQRVETAFSLDAVGRALRGLVAPGAV